MTPADTGRVLMKAAAFDQRTVGEADVLAWHEVIGHFELRDCLAAIGEHYRESSSRAMPADIRRLAIRIRDERLARESTEQRRLAIESGPTVRDRSDAVTALVRQVAEALPKPDVYERAKARARAERGRPELLPPRQRKTPKSGKPKDWPDPASDDVAAMATRYLLDGHDPVSVSGRLAVSRRWCERTIRRLTAIPPEGAP